MPPKGIVGSNPIVSAKPKSANGTCNSACYFGGCRRPMTRLPRAAASAAHLMPVPVRDWLATKHKVQRLHNKRRVSRGSVVCSGACCQGQQLSEPEHDAWLGRNRLGPAGLAKARSQGDGRVIVMASSRLWDFPRLDRDQLFGHCLQSASGVYGNALWLCRPWHRDTKGEVSETAASAASFERHRWPFRCQEGSTNNGCAHLPAGQVRHAVRTCADPRMGARA